MRERKGALILLIGAMAVAFAVFVFLYFETRIKIEQPQIKGQETTLSDWSIGDSAMNGMSFAEDKSIYEDVDNNIYDVYISVFPTKDASGELLDFSSFGKHVSRDRTYNPVLNCNIQILDEDETLDPLLNLDAKNATIRVRGNSSRGDIYKSYKVKLTDKADSFFGQTTLNINKHSEDVTKIATKLETALLSDMDHIASYRTYFMRLWIRDASLPKEEQTFRYYGLYTEIEQPNKTYLELRGLSKNAVMYKARNFNFSLAEQLKNVDDPEYDEDAFESVLSIREGTDHEKLLEMLEAVNDETNNFKEVFQKYFNEDNYLTWLAFNLLVGNNDIINHNFIIYSPDNSNTWYFLPWDFDGTLQFGEQESSLMYLPPSLKGGQKLNQSVLHRRYIRMPGSIEKIQKKMEELLETYITRERIAQLVSEYKGVLAKTMTLEPDLSLLEMYPSELPAYLDSLYDGIYEKYKEFQLAVQYPMPMYVAMPEQNADGTVHFSWQPSYSYQGRTITYNVQVFSDYYMTDLLLEKQGIVENYYDTETYLAPGIYYLKVTAVDSAGNEQLSMERYETMLTAIKAFYVNGLLEFEIK